MVDGFKVVDLFCGAGGFSRGFMEEGFDIKLGVDSSEVAAESYKANFASAQVLVEDISQLRSEDIMSLVGEVDMVIGSPPCEAFTGANAQRRANPLDRLFEDPKGRLVLHFIRIVGDLQPRVFIMENVPGLMDGPLREILKSEFARVGYKVVYFNILKAEDYGTPSSRLRLFISNIKITPTPFPRKVKVFEAIGDLPPPESPHDIPNHSYISLPPRKQRRIIKLRWGEALIRYAGAEGRIYCNYIRLHPYRLAPTVMGSSRFIHPFDDRLLTVREQARLMSFPDSHVFRGGKESQLDQVGEAVPPSLSRAIAQHVKIVLKRDQD